MRLSPKTHTRRRTPGDLFALATVLIISGVFVFNNLAPYLGLNYVTAMTMFSGLSPNGENHLFMPSLQLSDASTYVVIRQARVQGRAEPGAAEFRRFANEAMDQRKPIWLNFVRYQTSRVCASSPDAVVQLSLETRAGQSLQYDNACAAPEMQRYALFTNRDECIPSCSRQLKLWARRADPAL